MTGKRPWVTGLLTARNSWRAVKTSARISFTAFIFTARKKRVKP